MAIIEPEFLYLTRNLDITSFWEENECCFGFTLHKPRCAVSFSPDDHWIFEFMGVPSTLRYYQDKPYRDRLHKEANQILRQYVGKAFFEEDTWESSPNRIEYLFGCKMAYYEGSTPWLQPATADPNEFSKIIDQAEATDLCNWTFPEAFLSEWEKRKSQGKHLPYLGDGSRGPATIMTSALLPETAILWLFDYPDLMRRFRDVLVDKIIELNRLLREFSGNPFKGWWITDDNCALFNRNLYREYCYPVLEKVMDTLAPGNVERYQHSDSAMGHLLDYQADLGICTVNYGPEVDAGLIRQKMPDAKILGQMPPFLLRNGSPQAIQDRIISDFVKAGKTGGLQMTTSGSLAAGTGVGRMRWFMKVVQDFCKYRD